MRYMFELLYLASSVLFIVGLKFLSNPARARQGNTLAALGMAVATVTLLVQLHAPGAHTHNLWLIVLAIAIGAVAGAVGARRVAMTCAIRCANGHVL